MTYDPPFVYYIKYKRLSWRVGLARNNFQFARDGILITRRIRSLEDWRDAKLEKYVIDYSHPFGEVPARLINKMLVAYYEWFGWPAFEEES